MEKTPYRIVKKVKQGFQDFYHTANCSIDLEDDKTWKLFPLSGSPEIRGEVRRLLDLKGVNRYIIPKKERVFNFAISYVANYVANDSGQKIKETRSLFVPPKLIQGYGIDESMAIELDLNEIIYPRGNRVLMYEKTLIEGPKDVMPIEPMPNEDEILDVEKLTMEYSSTPSQWNILLDLMKKAKILGLDMNWFISVVSLQLQEVAPLKCAEKLNLNLDKENVEKILGREIKCETEVRLRFRDQYEAISKKVEQEKKVKMSKLPTEMRGIRAEVLHYGYNPLPEDVKGITAFTLDFLDKLSEIFT